MSTDLRQIPVRYEWVGGYRAGYALYDFNGREICRVWPESDVKFAMRYECIRPGSFLVDEVIEQRWPRKLAKYTILP